jgi:antirestriction protein
MRKKAFYSDQEIIKNLYTTGKEWMLNDYTEYVGQYHRYTTGEVYTQPAWNQILSEQLVAYQELAQDVKTYKSLKSISTSYENNIKSYKPIISQDAKKSGSIIRYFIKRYDSENVIEISADTYNQYTRNQIDNNIYQTTSI